MLAARRIAWTLGAVAALVNVLGYALSLYELAWFDEGLHAFTLFALTFIAAWLLRDDVPRGSRKLPYFMVVVACGVALGTVWELVEWAYDAFSAADSIRGKQDTMFDLILDAAGAVLAALLALWVLPASR